MECALSVGAVHGFGDASVAEVLAMAQCSSAEFQKHFTAPVAMWQAVADTLSNEAIAMIEATAGEFVDAAKRVACGVRLYLGEANDNPVFARFVTRSGLAVVGVTSLVHLYLPSHISCGNRTARFSDGTLESAVDLITGTTLAAVRRIADGEAPADHPQRVALLILRSLGVPAPQARRLATIDLPHLPAPSGSLLWRARAMSHARSMETKRAGRQLSGQRRGREADCESVGSE